MHAQANHELFERYENNPILSVNDWPYGANAVFNAAAADVNDEVLLLIRVEDFRGISHLTVARSKDGIGDWQIDPAPTLMPRPADYPEETWGIEDPRITWIEELGKYAICYTSYSQGGPLVSIAMTEDFKTYQRLGPVMPPEDKDAALFPVRFDGLWAMIHRPVPRSTQFGANIWISFSPDLKHWGNHQEIILARRGGWWDANKIGLSAPPLRTEHGWLLLYHGVKMTVSGSIYRLGMCLLDLNDTLNVLRRTDKWIFGPRAVYEREGDVDDVVFPCGWVVRGDMIYMYYGAADSCIALATAKLDKITEYLLQCPTNDHEQWWKTERP